ncbi:MAG: hypothetical protein JWP44_136 [Mucilaginibacter sp.]|nr:hypothetical protein [Mucilaginibacter sp.]
MNFFSELRLYICNHLVSKIPSHTFRLWFYRVFMKFSIGKKAAIFLNCSFDCSGSFKLGNNSVINSKCRFDNRGGVIIGDNVSVSQNVIILTADHDMDSITFEGRTNKVVIEDYAWIGTRAMILPGVTIGRGAVVAAGAIVSKNVTPFSVVAGVPAKVIKNRNKTVNYTLDYRRLFQ